jgi:hypothetical protein
VIRTAGILCLAFSVLSCNLGYSRHRGLPTTVRNGDFYPIESLVILPAVSETPVTETLWDNDIGAYRQAEDSAGAENSPPAVRVSPGKTLRDTRIEVPFGRFLVQALGRYNIRLLTPARVSESVGDLYVMEIEQFSVREGPRDRLNLFSKLHLLRYSRRGDVVFERIYTKATDKADVMDLESDKPFIRKEINRVVEDHCTALVDQIMAESSPRGQRRPL